ncbi:hypothetical protein D9M71_523610 [compost metagenome]
MEDQPVVTPFEIAIQVRVQARQAQGHRIVALAQAHVEGKTVGDAFAGTQVGEGFVDPVGVDAIHGLAEAILDHEAENQPLDVLAHLDLHFEDHRLTDFCHFHRTTLGVKQADAENARFACPGNGLHLPVGEHLLTHRLALALGEHGVVVVHHFFGLAAHGHAPVFQEDGGVADRLDRGAVMGHDQQRGAGLAEVADAIEAFVLEVGVAHRQRFVDDQDIRPPRGGHAERQTHLHAAGIGAHRMVDGLADFGEALDFRHQRFDFFHLHAK